MTDLVLSKPVSTYYIPPFENEARMINVINKVTNPEFLPYIQEAWHCYIGQAHNAAIIWIWCAVSCYIRTVVKHVGEELFRFKIGENIESLEKINDEKLIETCREMGILGLSEIALFGWVNDFRKFRNDLAHGKWQERATQKTVVEFAEGAVQYFLIHSVEDWEFSGDVANIYDMAKSYEANINNERVKTIINAIKGENEKLNLCHRLIGLNVQGDASNPMNVKIFIREIYTQLSSDQRAKVIPRAIKDTARFLGLYIEFIDDHWAISQTSPNEERENSSEEKFRAMLDIDFWIDNDLPEVHRNGYYEIFKNFLGMEINREGGSNYPHRYFKKIREYAPENYKSEIAELASKLL